MIRQMAINWEFDEILVKEHPTVVGRRDRQFYKDLLKIPGVSIVAPSINTYEVLKKASFVYSISGTALFEATALGILAGSGTNAYFSHYLSHGHVDPFKPLTEKINKPDIRALLIELHQNSFDGNTRDQIMFDEVLSETNIANIALGFCRLYESVK